MKPTPDTRRRATCRPALSLFAFGLASGLAQAGEAEIRAAVTALAGPDSQIEEVKPAGFLDLYEVLVDGQILYADSAGRYVVVGRVIEAKGQRDLTEERKTELARLAFAELPLELAAKQVQGKGRRVLVTFEDPNCPYCRKLAQELERIDDLTVYTFLLPILSPDSAVKARAIWCAKDRGRAWRDWIIDGKAPPAPTCEVPLDRLQALGDRHGIQATPTLLFPDGRRIDGYAPAARVEQALGAVANR
jgi:thiol:disulfide interchange protein DsbC